MNIKFNIGTIVRLIDPKISMEQLYKQLQPMESKAGLTFCQPQAGAGYYQWTLNGNDWVSFTDLDDSIKPLAAQKFKDCKAAMSSLMNGAPLVEYIFTVPSEAHIFFRSNGENLDMALAAWAYKYPDRNMGNALETWRSRIDMQDVHIGFLWDEKKIPHLPFKVDGLPRKTGEDGMFHVDGKLPVGKSLTLSLESGKTYPITVEKGRADYLYDLTQHFTVDVLVKKDDHPLPETSCTVEFGKKHTTLTTDADGHAGIFLPLAEDESGHLLMPQPDCRVGCQGEMQVQKPGENEDRLRYEFHFHTPVVEEKKEDVPPVILEEPPVAPPPPPVKDVTLTLLDYGGYPLQDMKATLTLKGKGEITVVTDKEGKCTIPQDWFEDKKKVKVNFVVTPEYQQTHDIHYHKKSSKKNRKENQPKGKTPKQ